MRKLLILIRFFRKSLCEYVKNYSKDFIFNGKIERAIHVLGNGPSLDQSLYLIKDSDDVIMVNWSVTTELFIKLKPKFFCIADPAFFDPTGNTVLESRKDAMFKALNKIEWPLTIILPSDVSASNLLIKNENITFEYVNRYPVDHAIKKFRFWLFKKNYSMPALQNVVIMGAYVALQRGYEKVVLHGVDSDSYKNICVNQNNEMFQWEQHFYGKVERNLNVEFTLETGGLYKVLSNQSIAFRSYVDLSNYAEYLGTKVVNASPNSMIDAFARYVHNDQLAEMEPQPESGDGF